MSRLADDLLAYADLLSDATVPSLAYAPGVPPFDPTNPTHVQAWSLFNLAGRPDHNGRAKP